MIRLPAFSARNYLRLRVVAAMMVSMTPSPLIAVFHPNGLIAAVLSLGCAATGFAIWAHAWIAEGDPPPPILADHAAHMPPPAGQ